MTMLAPKRDCLALMVFLLGCEPVVGSPEQHPDFSGDTTGEDIEWSAGTASTPLETLEVSGTPIDPATPSDAEDSGPATPGESETGDGDGELESEGDSSDGPLPDMHVDPPRACDGEVPEACLDVTNDAAQCTEGSACERSACTQRAFADFRLAMMRCLERECGVEPAYELDCVEGWADLEESCLIDHCELTGTPCQYMSIWGWQAECRR